MRKLSLFYFVLYVQVLLVVQVRRVLMVALVALVLMELPEDQENLAVQDQQGCQERKVSLVVMEFQDQLESKENQVRLLPWDFFVNVMIVM